VPQDEFYAAEWFGSYNNVLDPGLKWAGFDCFGACVTLKAISNRIEQIVVDVPTKTKDNVFVNVKLAVHMAATTAEAIYKLSNPAQQVDAYVSDVIRSHVPSLTIDETFEAKDEMANAVRQHVGQQLESYGFKFYDALVTDIRVGQDVMHAMNEVNKQKRLRDAAEMAAEAEKIRTVKQAEGEADAAWLQGQGIARERAAIIEGLRNSLTSGGVDSLSTEDITQLLLTTQYFECIKDIGSQDTAQAFFVPHDDPNDPDAQVLSGLLQGTAALEYLRSDGVPGQQRMGGNPGSTRRSGTRVQPPAAPPATPPRLQLMSPAAPYSPPPPVQAQAPERIMQIQIPPGVVGGQTITVQAPDGRMLQVQVPPGVGPGATIQIQA